MTLVVQGTGATVPVARGCASIGRMDKIKIHSEIGRLRAVIVHEPGAEIENMAPGMAASSLYDDLLFLPPAQYEHRQLRRVLEQVATVYHLTDLMQVVLQDAVARRQLVAQLCELHACPELSGRLVGLPPEVLARQLICGTPMKKDTLSKFLSPRAFSLPPLPNAFFMRDAAMCIHDKVVISAMASHVRASEAAILRALFHHHPDLRARGVYFDGTRGTAGSDFSLEGGDVLVLRSDLMLVGLSGRTRMGAIDQLLHSLVDSGRLRDMIVVELPETRATIHLDMTFTMLDEQRCLVYPPLMTGPRRAPAIHIRIEDGRVARIEQRAGLLDALSELGVDLKPVSAGGDDPLVQEREQWSSGANVFTMAPGVVIGYERNRATFEALGREGYRVMTADAFVAEGVDIDRHGPLAIMMEGEELNRGGGGCRCMTLPVYRDDL